jgi:ABC-type nickel/cobalt efflux system permease component RcnA
VLGTQDRSETQQQATISYQVDASAAATGQPSTVQQRSSAGTTRLAGYLEGSTLSVWVVLLALGAAALLGALHALTPGHAKTLMAAYLVGSGGTARNAVTLGAVVTFTHTASVVVIGLIALFASQFLVPGVLVPILEGVAGLLVLGLGVRLLRQRWPSPRPRLPARSRELVLSGASNHADRSSPHHHSHVGHGHDDRAQHAHQHGGRAHSHALPAEGITFRSLMAMGVSGGLVPCPEALGVMILAVGVNRTVFGLGLILSFSFGLAAVLIGFGVLLVRSRTLLTRVDRLPTAWITVLPLVSATVVTVLGAGLILKAIGADVLPPL